MPSSFDDILKNWAILDFSLKIRNKPSEINMTAVVDVVANCAVNANGQLLRVAVKVIARSVLCDYSVIFCSGFLIISADD